ncbi:imidazolonepropionase [Bacteroidia bacterium]|nr:imidazolonepropionase [Bacteroidia bacterium]
MQKLIVNINRLFGILPPDTSSLKGDEMSKVNTISNAYLLLENDRIVDFGKMEDLPESNAPRISGKQFNILPSFIDSHTHLVFAETRENEFEMKIEGKTYAEIAASGGGILNSAKKIAQYDEYSLFESAYKRAQDLIQLGTGAIEIKSGYGLDPENELKILRVINRLKEALHIPVKRTFLAAHAKPKSFEGGYSDYVKHMLEKTLPQAAQLADYIDVFCENGFFTASDAQTIIDAGKKHGLKAKIHGNQLGHSGGALVAAENNILSVDHLEFLNQNEIMGLQRSSTFPVVLPNCSFYLKMQYAPAKAIINAGLPLVIASDFNPGSAPSGNLWTCWSLACTQMRITPEQAFNALTINAAAALELEKEMGSITKGKKANLIFTAAHDNISYYPYSFGENHAEKVMVDGEFVSN